MAYHTLNAEQFLTLVPNAAGELSSQANQDNRAGMIFGGQVLCQSLLAAQTDVPGWPAHHLFGQFLRGGKLDAPVDYDVQCIRDGRRYANRRVVATQAGKPIFDCFCSFHAPEKGSEHQIGDIAGIPAPETLVDVAQFSLAHADRVAAALTYSARLPFPVEVRLTDPEGLFLDSEMEWHRDFWFRVPSAAGITSGDAHHCLLAMASDYWLAWTANAADRDGSKIDIVSLNHCIWFHGSMNSAEWLLFRTDCPWTGAGRGLARGTIYDRTGKSVASVVQELQLRRI